MLLRFNHHFYNFSILNLLLVQVLRHWFTIIASFVRDRIIWLEFRSLLASICLFWQFFISTSLNKIKKLVIRRICVIFKLIRITLELLFIPISLVNIKKKTFTFRLVILTILNILTISQMFLSTIPFDLER